MKLGAYVFLWSQKITLNVSLQKNPRLLFAGNWPVLTESHRIGGNQKCSWQSAKVDQKSLETVFSIAICRQLGDKWQSKTLFLTIFDLRLAESSH